LFCPRSIFDKTEARDSSSSMCQLSWTVPSSTSDRKCTFHKSSKTKNFH